MLTQTWAIFFDAYRELNSKKLFWITMVLSGLVVALFAAIGIDETSPTFLWMHARFIPVNSNIIPPSLLYKLLFVNLGLGVWLTWIATILALISTAPVFPDMVASGAIETVLSKPISRTRLFLTKYAAGLLFVTLQVAVFTGACFLVIGIRGGAWEPGLLLAIPIVVIFFSYLFAVCAVLGLLTRSTIAALLLTILFWFGLYLLNMADAILVSIREQTSVEIESRVEAIANAEAGTTRGIVATMREEGQTVPEGFAPTPEQLNQANPFIAQMRKDNEESRSGLDQLSWWSGLLYWVKTPLPKTGETVQLMERVIVDAAELDAAQAAADAEQDEPAEEDRPRRGQDRDQVEAQRRTEAVFKARSAWWVMGTSLGFEAVVLAFGAWRFKRRDF